MKRTLTLLVLLVTSQFTYADKQETCLAKSIYHEARGEATSDWLKVASVAYNRLQDYKSYGAKTQTLCSVVQSKQYTTRSKLNKVIKEKETYKKILKTLRTKKWKGKTKNLFFSSKKGKLLYSKTWRKK